jgi:uncharacterized protein (UPF0276 family)
MVTDMVGSSTNSNRGLASLPFLGVGLAFRQALEQQIWANQASVGWLEVTAEHYMSGLPECMEALRKLLRAFPVIPHGIELSIGSDGDLDCAYVTSLAKLIEEINAPWFSDHLCFTKAGGIALGQLMPLPRTRECAMTVARKAQSLQGEVGIPFLLENIAYYLDLPSELSEAQFISEVMEHCECGLLLDLTNVFINSLNHRFDTLVFVDSIPLERVVQIHLAGGEPSQAVFMDSHSAPVHEEVFGLLRYVSDRTPNLKGISIERDGNFPASFCELECDLEAAQKISAVLYG